MADPTKRGRIGTYSVRPAIGGTFDDRRYNRPRGLERRLIAGPDALADHEMLEIVLFALPRRDTKPLARDLLSRFGSFARVIAAPVQDLRSVEGLGETGVAALKSVHAAALRRYSGIGP